MSNPLLQPDGRFRREHVLDEAGHNRFSEEGTQPPAEASESNTENTGLPAPPSEFATASYQPRYTVAYPHRGNRLLTLGAIGFSLSWLLLLAFTSYVMLGLAASTIGVALSLATVILAYNELSGMSLGAIDPAGRDSALLGFRLALAGVFLGIGASLFIIWLMIRGIVEFSLF